MVKRGWDAHVLGVAPHTFTDAVTAVKTLRVRLTGPQHARRIATWLCDPAAGQPRGA
jgi:2,3-bisphosphoglycerate-independent phosphoglycerate mutase